jgi:hypothetical protein
VEEVRDSPVFCEVVEGRRQDWVSEDLVAETVGEEGFGREQADEGLY